MDKEYLQEDFDPSKVKVARLREILRENDIVFPSVAKKKELVGIFNETIGNKKLSKERHSEASTDTLIANDTKDSVEIIEIDEASPGVKPKKTKRKTSTKHVNTEEEEAVKDDSKEEMSPDVSKASIDESENSTLQKSPKPTKSPFGSSPPSKKLKKRKSSVFDELKKTPERGNLFQVDMDSDSDTVIFSPKPKKAKTTPLPAPAKTTKRKVSSKKQPKASPSPDVSKSINLDVEKSVAKSTPTKAPEPVSPKVETEIKQEVHRPVLDPILDSTTDASRDDSEDNFNGSLKNELVDDATGFDAALSRLKRHDSQELEHTKERKDAELAKLLGVDLNGVKPKPKGRRSITPRRPIIIPERRLASDRGSLLDDLDKEVSSSATETEEQTAAPSDEEADTDIEDEEETADERSLASRVRNQKRKSPSFATTLLFVGLWIFLIGFAMFGYWYREQTILIGYCGHEIDKPTIPRQSDTPALISKLGDYLDNNFKPSCVPCPQHARCFTHLELGCYEDFVESKPWYYQYWPVFDPRAKRCIPDTKKAKKVELMIDEALDLLRARNANIQCGLTAVDNFEAGIEVNELHDLLLALKAPYITEEEFEDLWKRSVVELEKEPEITVRQVATF